MQKPLAILLISIHLFGNTELNQVFKIPKLISHYYQHHRQNHTVSFLDFLAMHYGGDDGTSADDDIDAQLPFHHPDYRCLFMAYCPMEQTMDDTNASLYENTEYGSRLITVYPSRHVNLIRRPPKKS